MNGAVLLTGFMVTLFDLGVIFWAGAHCWQVFVIARVQTKTASQKLLVEQISTRFTRVLSFPLMILVLLTHIGVILGQALLLTRGQWTALSPILFNRLMTHSAFGVAWLAQEVVIVIALLFSTYPLLYKQQAEHASPLQAQVNLLVAFALLLVSPLSPQTLHADINRAIYAIVIEWLYLTAQALLIGGMLYLAFIYLPTVERVSQNERFAALAAILPRYTAVAQVGMVLLIATGLLAATIYQHTWNTFFASASGRIVIIELIAVVVLVLLCGFYLWRLLPRLLKEYDKYAYAATLLARTQTEAERGATEDTRRLKWVQVRTTLRSERLATLSQWVMTTLRCAVLPAVAIVVCTAFLSVTLGMANLPSTDILPQTPSTVSQLTFKPLQFAVKTRDNLFTVTITINPNQVGANAFTVSVVNRSGTSAQVSRVTLQTLMLDMNMGSDTIPLQNSGVGQFHGTGSLYMSGHWQISVLIYTPDGHVHEAVVRFATSS